MTRLTPFGDGAVRFAVPAAIAERRALLARLRGVRGVRDVVLCEEIGCVVFEDGAERGLVAEALVAPLAVEALAPPRRHVIRVVYDGEDLDAVATAIGRTREDVARMHADGDYVVAMLGFLPGFAYLRGLARELCLPRRAPRPRVPARSVAIGAEYTGIYPMASAGGWHLLGRAAETPAFERFDVGDAVRFEAVDHVSDAMETPASAPRPAPRGAHLVVTRAAGLALFVDTGRAGQMHRGRPPGGPLVRGAFAQANAAVGNGAARAIELTGSLEVEARGGTVTLGIDGQRVALRAGERFALASGGGARVAYLAVEGGFDAPGFDAPGCGPALRRGDVLAVSPLLRSGSARVVRSTLDRLSTEEAIELRAGPELSDELRAAIERGAFTISPTSDRAGTRLAGTALPGAGGARASAPMVEGAIELTPSGLVVLGPEHPTTGGYPVPAVLASTSRDAFFARPLGAPVRFTFRD